MEFIKSREGKYKRAWWAQVEFGCGESELLFPRCF
jgi:hypothetical protein